MTAIQPVKREKIMVLGAGDMGSHYLVTARQRQKFQFVRQGGVSLRITDKELWNDIGELLKDNSVDILLPKDTPSTELTKYDIIIRETMIKGENTVLTAFSNTRYNLRKDLFKNCHLPSIFDYYRFTELYNILVGKGIYIHYDNINGKSGEYIDEYVELLEKFKDVYERYLKLKPVLLELEDATSIEDIKRIKDEYEADM